MKIGILSDPHKKISLQKEAISLLKSQGAKMLIHSGDLRLLENLQMLKDCKIPYVSIFGNNDYHLMEFASDFNIYNEPYNFKIKDVSITLMHKPLYFEENSDIYIFGHTHTFKCNYSDKTLILNPGELCGRETSLCECVLLNIKKDKYVVTHNYTDIQHISWKKEEFVYER
jgi:putative phosphoesterase